MLALTAPPAAAVVAAPPQGDAAGPAGSRPRVLLRPADVAMMQARCGVPPRGGGPVAAGEGALFASRVGEFRRIQEWVDENLELPLEDGALYLPAFLHLMTGQPGRPDKYVRCVERELNRRLSLSVDFDDVAAALDWCWEALEPACRKAASERLVQRIEPLSAGMSPFEHYLLHPKLCEVAAAIALEGCWPEGTPEGRRIARVLEAAQGYLEKTLPAWVEQTGGLAPASSLQAHYEADVVYAVELWSAYRGEDQWGRYAAALRDACDVYFWCDPDWPTVYTPLLHDFGGAGAAAPGEAASALAAGSAEVLARRTGSAVAAWYARLATEARPANSVRELNRLWMHILHGRGVRPIVDRLECPLARKLKSGWVVMRSDWRPGATVVAFDAAQPHWLARQHDDAGQFQIVRKGRLALDSGDDVRFAAAAARGGAQGIGTDREPFEVYTQSTVAHNCLLLSNPRRQEARPGSRWPLMGNQRLIAGDWDRPTEPIDRSERLTGRLIAFETHPHYSYAAADLAKAYDEQTALLYDRHLLFVGGRFLFVVDRVVAEREDVRPTWLLHLPARPKLDGKDLDAQFRRRGLSNAAGAWWYPQFDGWLTADGGEGRLFVRTLLPQSFRWCLIGGPQEAARVAGGAFEGRTYVGSDERGFECWLYPGSAFGGANAWYRLGQQVTLDAGFGSGSGWGRLEVEATEPAAENVFVHVLAAVDQAAEQPRLTATCGVDEVRASFEVGGMTYEVELSPRGADAGRVVVRRGANTVFSRTLTHEVQPNAQVPVRR